MNQLPPKLQIIPGIEPPGPKGFENLAKKMAAERGQSVQLHNMGDAGLHGQDWWKRTSWTYTRTGPGRGVFKGGA